MLYDRIAIHVATRAEIIQNSKHWILTINAEGLQLARTKKNTGPFLAVNGQDSEKDTNFEGNEEYDYAIDPKTGRRFYKGSRRNLQTTSSGRGPICRQLRDRRQIGTKRIGRRAIGLLSILQALTIGEFSMATSTEIRCRSLGGPSCILCYLTELLWRIIHTSRQKLREFEIRHIGFSH